MIHPEKLSYAQIVDGLLRCPGCGKRPTTWHKVKLLDIAPAMACGQCNYIVQLTDIPKARSRW